MADLDALILRCRLGDRLKFCDRDARWHEGIVVYVDHANRRFAIDRGTGMSRHFIYEKTGGSVFVDPCPPPPLIPPKPKYSTEEILSRFTEV